MKKSRIYFSAWGRLTTIYRIPQYAVGNDNEALSAICRCVERATGMEVGTYQYQGTRFNANRPAGRHYQLSLGRKNPRGGFDIEGELWIEIPA
jgi:hypothetical protein